MAGSAPPHQRRVGRVDPERPDGGEHGDRGDGQVFPASVERRRARRAGDVRRCAGGVEEDGVDAAAGYVRIERVPRLPESRLWKYPSAPSLTMTWEVFAALTEIAVIEALGVERRLRPSRRRQRSCRHAGSCFR
jgi:hypothetical protein